MLILSEIEYKPATGSMSEPRRRRRLSPDESRHRLIAATLEVLMDEGAAGASIRRISAKAGVSVGLINHHFEGIDHLMAAAYGRLADDFRVAIEAKLRASSGTARERLSLIVCETFAPRGMNRRALRAWATFWGLVEESPPVQAAHRRTHGAMKELIETMLTQTAEERETTMPPAQAALGLVAIIDGLWLNWCLEPDNFRPAEGVKLCEIFIDRTYLRQATD